MKVEVSLSLNTNENFSYEYRGNPDLIRNGKRVVVPVWNRLTTGWVVNCDSNYNGKVKPILGIVDDEYIPDEKYLKFVLEISNRFLISQGKILDLSLSPAMRSVSNMYIKHEDIDISVFKKSFKDLDRISGNGVLNVFYKIKGGKKWNGTLPRQNRSGMLCEREHKVFISYNRIDLYNTLWEEEKKKGKTPVLLIPNSLSKIKYEKMIPELKIYNSNLKYKEREDIWQSIRVGKSVFVGGGEAVIFLPIADHGTIIIEKSGSFFYDKNISSGIDLREAARIKADILGVPVIEGNGNMTSYYYYNRDKLDIKDERDGKYKPISVKKLNPGTKIPPSQVIDTIIDDFTEGNRVLVVVSKKESSRFLFCSECNGVFKCPSCRGSVAVVKNREISCKSCSFSDSSFPKCSKCNSELKIVEDISVNSLKNNLKKMSGENSVKYLEKKSPKDFLTILKRDEKNNIVILTPSEVNCIPEKSFDSVIFIKPESFFDLNDYNGSEQIFSFLNGLRDIISTKGKIVVYSVFDFHYSLKNINDEEKFLERELKYRDFFFLPPFYDIFGIELSERDLRKLAEKMRSIHIRFHKELNIRKIYLLSRSKIRGFYRGILHVHSGSEELLKSGIMKIKGTKVKSI